jgi:hypothetical protein
MTLDRNKKTALSQFENDLDFMPTSAVPAWAMRPEKPSYTYSEITGLPTLFDGNYNSLTNKPAIPAVPGWALASTKPSYSYSELSGLPSLFDGNYASLTNKPSIPVVPAWALATTKPSYSYSELSGLPTLFDGNYASLTNKPSIPVVPAWALASTKPSYSYSELSGLPTLFDGNYASLTNKPSIPVVPGWALATTKPSYSYSELSGLPSLFDGNYNSLTNKPTIPSVYAWALAANKPSYSWSEIGSKPITLAGYGITETPWTGLGYITSSALNSYLPLSGGTMTGTQYFPYNKAAVRLNSGTAGYGAFIDYDTNGAECMGFGVDNAGSSFKFKTGIAASSMAGGSFMNITPDFEIRSGAAYVNGSTVIHSGNIGSQSVNYANNAGYAGYATYLPTCYAGGYQSNPQVYFNINVGVKVAMTAAAGTWSDTLWINGYAGSDVKAMCALHFQRNGTPRAYISTQNSDSTSYGTAYELLTEYNYTNFAATVGHTHTYAFNGSWMANGGSYGFTYYGGWSMPGGSEFSILYKNGQGSILTDGSHYAMEGSGFYSGTGDDFGVMKGFCSDGTNCAFNSPISASNFIGSGAGLTGNANSLYAGYANRVVNDNTPMAFHWSGQGGQPTWLWGGNSAGDMYVYNPSNFSVNYANTSGHANDAVTKQDGSRYTTDFNSILTSGFYNAESTPSNCPSGYGQLIVAKGIDTGMQIYGGYSSDNIWFRGWWSSGSGFSSWRKVWHDGNFTPSNYSLTSHTHDYATHRGEGTNYIDNSYRLYDNYRGGWRTSDDLYVAYAYNAGNASFLNGFTTDMSATANTVVMRNSNGHIYGNYILGSYINSSRGDESSAAASYIYDTGDGYMRKKTLANTRAEIVTSAAMNAAVGGTVITAANIGTYAPSNYDAGHYIGTGGYQKFSSGLIIQWGRFNTNSTVYFVTPFPNACCSISCTNIANNYTEAITATSITTSSFYATEYNKGSNAACYIAIGY